MSTLTSKTLPPISERVVLHDWVGLNPSCRYCRCNLSDNLLEACPERNGPHMKAFDKYNDTTEEHDADFTSFKAGWDAAVKARMLYDCNLSDKKPT